MLDVDGLAAAVQTRVVDNCFRQLGEHDVSVFELLPKENSGYTINTVFNKIHVFQVVIKVVS